MNRLLILVATLFFSFGFAEKTQLEEFEMTHSQSEVESLSEQKKALNEMYNELTDEQRASLEEEFQAEIEGLNKKIEMFSGKVEE